MELVCSPRLLANDVRAYVAGLEQRPRWIRRKLQHPQATDWHLKLLTWATVHRRLFIKVAMVRHDPASPPGIYHEKFGLVTDSAGHRTGFSGSPNESRSAYVSNFERVQVFDERLDSESSHVRSLHEEFERLWHNETPGLEVVPLHEALAAGQVETLRNEDELGEPMQELQTAQSFAPSLGETLVWPARLELRPYQEEAIGAWFRNGGRGIFAMATGSGKTITALGAATRLFERVGGPLVVVVVAPFLVLVDQWTEVMKSFGLQPIRCAEGVERWRRHAESAVYLANRERRTATSLVVTNATFRSEAFQRVLARLQVRTLLIADEVHNLGARALLKALPERVSLRLGLSATPERKWDDEGTRALERYFGDPVIRFGLREAMGLDPPVLTPYSYHPVLVELEEDEIEEYLRLTRSLARLLGDSAPDQPADRVRWLLIKRARLIGSARGKLKALRRVMQPLKSKRLNLVYCGDGRTDPSGLEPDAKWSSLADEEDSLERQIKAVVRLLGHDLGMRVAFYTAETSAEDRRKILRAFTEGTLQGLVAIRCLDEGVDIPAIRRAFLLASSTNPRQFIQRRGRVLRRFPGKDQAEIYDFFVIPPILDDALASQAERQLVRREMERALDFLALATNATAARHRLLPILKRVDSLDLLARRNE